jgi:hypothetical protein
MRTRATLLVAVFLFPTLASAGLVFEQTQRGDGEGAEMMNATTRVSVSDKGAKIEFLKIAANNPLFTAGSYILMRPKDTGMIIVNPADETWARFDPSQMAAMAGQMMQQRDQQMKESSHGDMRTRVSDPTVKVLVDEAGPEMLGRPTRHRKVHVTYTLTQPMGGMQMDMMTDATEEVWFTEAVDLPSVKFLSGAGGGDFMGSSALAKVSEVSEAARVPGLPLKRVTTSTTKMGGKGMGMGMMSKMMNKNMKPSTITLEITKLEERDLPASLFAIPAGYAETDLFGGGAKMPDLNDPGN